MQTVHSNTQLLISYSSTQQHFAESIHQCQEIQIRTELQQSKSLQLHFMNWECLKLLSRNVKLLRNYLNNLLNFQMEHSFPSCEGATLLMGSFITWMSETRGRLEISRYYISLHQSTVISSFTTQSSNDE